MEELSKFERDALHAVSHGAMHIRTLARSLPDSETKTKTKILALAEGMHNIPTILAGPAQPRLVHANVVAVDVAELNAALGRKPVID